MPPFPVRKRNNPGNGDAQKPPPTVLAGINSNQYQTPSGIPNNARGGLLFWLAGGVPNDCHGKGPTIGQLRTHRKEVINRQIRKLAEKRRVEEEERLDKVRKEKEKRRKQGGNEAGESGSEEWSTGEGRRMNEAAEKRRRALRKARRRKREEEPRRGGAEEELREASEGEAQRGSPGPLGESILEDCSKV